MRAVSYTAGAACVAHDASWHAPVAVLSSVAKPNGWQVDADVERESFLASGLVVAVGAAKHCFLAVGLLQPPQLAFQRLEMLCQGTGSDF